MTVWKRLWSGYEPCSEQRLENIRKCDQYYALLKKLIRKPLETLKRDEPIRLVEIGCGSGIRTIALLSEFTNVNWDVTFIDTEKTALSLVKRSFENLGMDDEKINYMKTDIRSLSVEDEVYHIAWNEGVMEHFSEGERQLAFDEVYRICKPNGYYICIVPNKLSFAMLKNTYLRMSGNWNYGYQDEFTPWELKSRLKRAGFSIDATEGAAVFSPIAEVSGLFFQNRGGRDNSSHAKHETDERKSEMGRLLRTFEETTRIHRIIGKELGVLASKGKGR